MMRGTSASEKAVYEFMPEEVPKPLGWGTFKSQPNRHFYICSFINMLDEVPDAAQWAETVSRLHILSEQKGPRNPSSRDRFGFDITTHLANVPVDNTWQESWEVFWAQQMLSLQARRRDLRSRPRIRPTAVGFVRESHPSASQAVGNGREIGDAVLNSFRPVAWERQAECGQRTTVHL